MTNAGFHEYIANYHRPAADQYKLREFYHTSKPNSESEESSNSPPYTCYKRGCGLNFKFKHRPLGVEVLGWYHVFLRLPVPMPVLSDGLDKFSGKLAEVCCVSYRHHSFI